MSAVCSLSHARAQVQLLALHALPIPAALHDRTFRAAAGIFVSVVHVQLMVWPAWPSIVRTCIAGHVLVVLSDLTYNVVEGVVNVDAVLCGGFDEVAAE